MSPMSSIPEGKTLVNKETSLAGENEVNTQSVERGKEAETNNITSIEQKFYVNRSRLPIKFKEKHHLIIAKIETQAMKIWPPKPGHKLYLVFTEVVHMGVARKKFLAEICDGSDRERVVLLKYTEEPTSNVTVTLENVKSLMEQRYRQKYSEIKEHGRKKKAEKAKVTGEAQKAEEFGEGKKAEKIGEAKGAEEIGEGQKTGEIG